MSDITKGWLLLSADFSMQAAGKRKTGSVTLIRTLMQRGEWHKLPEDVKDSGDGPPLHVTGEGETIELAINDACTNAEKALPITPPITIESREMSLDVWLTIEVDTGGDSKEVMELYSANITHNLNNMADAAGIYESLWHPEQLDHTSDVILAGDLIKGIKSGLEKLKATPGKFKEFNASNGWGMYEHFVPFVEDYLEACERHPKAVVSVSV